MVAPPIPGFVSTRRRALDTQVRGGGATDERVIAAVLAVPRELFVPLRSCDGRVAEPHVTALLAEVAGVRLTDRVLVIGAVPGYVAAVLSRLAGAVYALAPDAERADAAREQLAALGYARIGVTAGDSTIGWREHAPYDVIIVAEPCVAIGSMLLAQLAPQGRLVIASAGASRPVCVTRED